MAKKVIQSPKNGDYFKGTLEDRKITGKIVRYFDYFENEQEEDLVALHFLEDLDEGISVEDMEEFTATYSAYNISDYEKITKREFNTLRKKVEYTGIGGYSFTIIKGKTKDQDKFSFGCGSITVTRKEVSLLLAITKLGLNSEHIYDLGSLMTDIEDKSSDAITENNLKQLLAL